MKISRDYILFFSIVLGICIAIFLMGYRNYNSVSFDDAALGAGTVSYYAEDSVSNKVHYMPKQNIDHFISGIKPYLNNKTVLYLGNSQAHSINQKEKDDNTMSGYLFNELLDNNLTFLSASIPNANLQEHYLLYKYFSSKLPQLKMLIIPVFMDDLRETGIRESYFSNFSNNNFTIKEKNKLAKEINKKLISFQNNIDTNTSELNINNDFNALKETTQDITERSINRILKENFSFWENREQIRGKYFITLYKTRNTLLNISSQSTRKMIKSRYNKNFEALNLIISEAQANNTKILLLIPPLRKDIKYPYDKKEYENFKIKLNQIATQSSVILLDIDNIIDGKYWGYSAPTQLFKEKDYDFMHFQSEGHKILADTLEPYILRGLL